MSKTEVTEEAAKNAEAFMARVMAFRKEMTLKEIRLLKLCQDGPNDTNGILAGVLWIARKRKKDDATFDDVMDLTEAELEDELNKVLPKVA